MKHSAPLLWSLCGLLALPSSLYAMDLSFDNIQLTVPAPLELLYGGDYGFPDDPAPSMDLFYSENDQLISVDFYTFHDYLPQDFDVTNAEENTRLMRELENKADLLNNTAEISLTMQDGQPLLCSFNKDEEEPEKERFHAAYLLPDRVIVMEARINFPGQGLNIIKELCSSIKKAPEEYRDNRQIVIHHNGVTVPVPAHWEITTHCATDSPEWLNVLVEDKEYNCKAMFGILSTEEGNGALLPEDTEYSMVRLGDKEAKRYDLTPSLSNDDPDVAFSVLYAVQHEGRLHLLAAVTPEKVDHVLKNDIFYMLHKTRFDGASSPASASSDDALESHEEIIPLPDNGLRTAEEEQKRIKAMTTPPSREVFEDKELNFSIVYPVFAKTVIDQHLMDWIHQQKEDFAANKKKKKAAGFDVTGMSWKGSCSLSYTSGQAVTVFIDFDLVGTSGIPMHLNEVLSFDLVEEKLLKVEDLFDNPDKAIALFSAKTRENLKNDPYFGTDWMQKASEPRAENFHYFLLHADGLTLMMDNFITDVYGSAPASVKILLDELAEAAPKRKIWE